MKRDSFDEIWIRVKDITGWRRQNDLAYFLKVKSTGISEAKGRGIFREKWATKIAEKYDITIEEILYGKSFQSVTTCEQTPLSPTNCEEFRISDKVAKTIEILESKTIYRTALAANIDAFHHAVNQEQTVQDLQLKQTNLEARMASLEKQLSSVSATPGDFKKEENDEAA